MIDQYIRESFDRQGLMKTIGAKILYIEEGKITIGCSLLDSLTQQHGFFHAGVLISIVDTACGYAALTMMRENSEVLTVEFKINFLKPAISQTIFAIGKVLQSGKTITFCEGIVTDDKQEKVFAKMTATMIKK